MANPEHVEIVRMGTDTIRTWRADNPMKTFDLVGAELRDVDLSNANLSGADLSRADLTGAVLTGANLRNANLLAAHIFNSDMSRADCREAELIATEFTLANLRSADLRKAELTWSSFKACDVNGALFSQCYCDWSFFLDMDLSGAIGLEKVKHRGPSTIGVNTLHASRGKIPETFLRGCGVPDSLIAMLPALAGALEPIQFYSCFISYSSKDDDFARRLQSRLRDEKLRVWYAPEDMKGGRKSHEQIESAIRIHDKLLLVLSENSMKSQWVKTEIYHARQREEREDKKVLFPISLVPFKKIQNWKAFDADTGKDMAREVREYHVPDFSNWKDHDAFEQAFQRLLSDLRQTAE